MKSRLYRKPTLCLLAAITLTTMLGSIYATGIVQSAGDSRAIAVTGVMLIALGNMIAGLFAS